MKICVHLWQYLAELFLDWEMLQTKVIEKTKTHILFISVFNQLDTQNLFHNKFYFMPLHVSRCDDTRGCVMQFWPPDDEHMCSKHVEAWNKTYCETNFVHQVG